MDEMSVSLASEYFSGIVLWFATVTETAIARAGLIAESKQFGGVNLYWNALVGRKEEGFWK